VTQDTPQSLQDALRTHFGFDRFRTGQEEAAAAILAGRDLVAVMPTGSGKSLCFQLPALLIDGTTVVVSPLIALMKDQVDGLRARGLAAAAVHSGIGAADRAAAESELAAGRLRLLYVAPERLANPGFRVALGRARVVRLVVDEAHCISQWGHDFRPDYGRIGDLRRQFGVPAAAFTATATPEVRADIARQLGLADPIELITGFERPNLTLAVEPCRTRTDKARAIDRLARAAGLPGIVYAATRKNVELWADHFVERGLRAGRYHAGMGDAERTRVQDDFLAGRLDVISATNAFGMGVDKRDLRFVAHADVPGSLEAYYQEVGRAGRDGLPARGLLLFSPADVRTQEFFLAGSNPSPGLFDRVWALLGDGADEAAIETAAQGDAATGMAMATAARLLRRAAESLKRRPGDGPPPVDVAALEAKARRDRARLDTMLAFAFGRGCRTRFIYDYFAGAGRGGAVPRCGTCDVCLGWRRAAGRELDDREFEQVRIALSAVARLDGRFGIARLAQVLAGSRSREVIDRGLDRIPTFGRLADLGVDAIRTLLDTLVEAALLERHGIEGGRPGAFVIGITDDGRAVMRAERRPALALPGSALRETPRPGGGPAAAPRKTRSSGASRPGGLDDQPPMGDARGHRAIPPEPETLARLKRWRAEEARRRGVPAYVIFHDATLESLAACRPADPHGLQAVRGIGPAKFEAYGEVLLRLLAEGP
jgi:ATP-dependent DNA helicase RecQ